MPAAAWYFLILLFTFFRLCAEKRKQEVLSSLLVAGVKASRKEAIARVVSNQGHGTANMLENIQRLFKIGLGMRGGDDRADTALVARDGWEGDPLRE